MRKDKFPFIKKAFEKKKMVLWDFPITITKITRLGIRGVPLYHIKIHNKKGEYINRAFSEDIIHRCLIEKQDTYFNFNVLTVKVAFQYEKNTVR
jgi:hypothetical protein